MSLNKRKGFTLAEVLITLGIIGVVAALTTPAIIENSQNAKIGPQVAKIKTTLETAIQSICMAQEKLYLKDVLASDVTDLSIDGKIDAMAGTYMKARAKTVTLPKTVDMTGAAYPVSGTIYEFADKSALVVPECEFGTKTESRQKDPNCVPSEGVTCEMEDVSVTVSYCETFALMPGYAKKNRLMLGRDFFPLMITNIGDVRTPGEAEDKDVTAECTDAKLDAGTETGYYCIDRIAANGWKANW